MAETEYSAKKDLRILFSTNAAGVDAEHIFIDREGERETFERAFHAHGAQLDAQQCDPEDVVTPRRNVIVYYGLGGIGKTTLSQRLASWVSGEEGASVWPSFDADSRRVITARLDLSKEVGLDFETMLVILRIAASQLKQNMTAFDITFSRYWAHAHPNERFSDYIQRQSALSKLSGALKLPDQLTKSLEELAGYLGQPTSGLSVLALTGKALITQLRSRTRRRQALNDCPRLPDLLEAGVDPDALGYYPYLLAWDLHRLQQKQPVRMVVFIDTFEDVGTRTNRHLERYLQRLVWLMPNVFFVVTGRNRLEWADIGLVSELDWVGPVSWPGLAIGTKEEPRQHLVGALSDRDSDRFLRDRLRHNGVALIGPEVRERIIANAHGLPLYLDLCVIRFVQLYNAESVLTPQEFDVEFPGLLARVFRDLGAEERAALRAVSLLDSFDVPIATATAGAATEATAVRLTDRPFVKVGDWEPWRYHLDELIRDHIVDADHGLDDSWSRADWRAAAQRAVDYMGHLVASMDSLSSRRLLINCLNQGLRLAHDFDLELGWLVDAAYRFVADHVWEPTLAPRIPDVDAPDALPSTAAQALAMTLVAIRARQKQHRQRTANQLKRCMDSGVLPIDAADLAAYFYAECMRDLGRWEESERGMRELVGPGRRMADTAARGLSHLQRRTGRFRDLQATLAGRERSAEWLRVTGDLCWTQGRFADADTAYQAARDTAHANGAFGEAALSEACRAFAVAFTDPQRAQGVVDSAREMLQAVTLTWAELQVRNAELLIAAGGDTDQSSQCDAVVAAAAASGLSSIGAYAELARGLHAAILGDARGLDVAATKLLNYVHGAEFSYLVEIIDFWRGTPSTPEKRTYPADWIDDGAVTAERWRALVRRRTSGQT